MYQFPKIQAIFFIHTLCIGRSLYYAVRERKITMISNVTGLGFRNLPTRNKEKTLAHIGRGDLINEPLDYRGPERKLELVIPGNNGKSYFIPVIERSKDQNGTSTIEGNVLI
jgi:hypothetical protein